MVVLRLDQILGKTYEFLCRILILRSNTILSNFRENSGKFSNKIGENSPEKVQKFFAEHPSNFEIPEGTFVGGFLLLDQTFGKTYEFLCKIYRVRVKC